MQRKLKVPGWDVEHDVCMYKVLDNNLDTYRSTFAVEHDVCMYTVLENCLNTDSFACAVLSGRQKHMPRC